MLVKNISEGDRKKLSLLGVIGIVFLGILLYSNILHAPFVFDDYSSILDNEAVKKINTAFSNFSNSRYAVDLSFALNYAADGTRPFGYHLVNNLLHVINALFVYWLVLLTFRTPVMANAALSGKLIAFASAFIFIAHPIQTQAVTYITQRYTSMATFFYLLSLIMYVKSRLMTFEKSEENRHGNRPIIFAFYGIALISAACALKSKEMAFTLPLIILLYDISFFSEMRSGKTGYLTFKNILYLLPVLLILTIVFLSMVDLSKPAATILKHIDATSRNTAEISRGEYLLTEFRVIVTYLRLLVFPVNQSLDYTYPVYRSFFNPEVILSFLLLVTIFFVGIYLFWRSRMSSPGYRLIAFGIFWFFITLSIESTIIPLKDVISEHRLYLSSIGFFIASVTAAVYLIRKANIRLFLISFVVICLSLATYSRNLVWGDPQILWENVLHQFPDNVKAHNAIGVELKKQKEYTKANDHFFAILKINPGYAPAHFNLGDIQLMQGNHKEALEYFKKAKELKSSSRLFFLDILNSLGITYSELGDNENAVLTFKEAIQKYPGFISPYNNLGMQYIRMGEADFAVETLEQALKIRESSHLYYNLSRAYDMKGDKRKSEEKYQRAMELRRKNI